MHAIESEPMRTVRPDNKSRITLGDLAAGVSSFAVEVREDGSIVLHPRVEIPAREAWLFRNKEALASVRRGLEESAKGEAKELGSFARYADE